MAPSRSSSGRRARRSASSGGPRAGGPRGKRFTMAARHAGMVASGAMTRGAMLLVFVLVLPWAARAEQHWKAVGRFPPGAPLAMAGRNVLIGARAPGTGAGVIHVYDLNTGAFRVELAAPGSLTPFAAAGDTLMAVESLWLLRLFDLRTGDLFRTFSADTFSGNGDDALGPVALSGGLLVSGTTVFDVATGAIAHHLEVGGARNFVSNVSAVAVVGDAIALATGVVSLFDAATGSFLRTFHEPGTSLAAAGANLLVGAPGPAGGTGGAFLIDPITGARLLTLSSPGGPPTNIFGRWVASVGDSLIVSSERADVGAPSDQGALLRFDAQTGALRGAFGDYTGGPIAIDDDRVAFNTLGGVVVYGPSCGDGVRDPCESCDDGNRVAGDGCDADCRLESCGNGRLDPGEQCDDGNTASGDGCDENCTPTGCGNCVITEGESCDDGNVSPGDGCDPNCTIASCGNGIIDSGEACDDGNRTPGDGCSALCLLEFCGNGRLDPGESCDGDDALGTCTSRCRARWGEAARRPTLTLEGRLVCPECYGFGESLAAAGSNILVGSAGPAQRIAPRTGTVLLTFPAPPFRYATAATDRWLVLGLGGEVRLFDAATGLLVRTFSSPVPTVSREFGAAVALAGSHVVVSDPSVGEVYQFDGDNGALLRTLEMYAPNLHPFGPSGSRILVGVHYDFKPDADLVRVFDGESGELRLTLGMKGLLVDVAGHGDDVFVGRLDCDIVNDVCEPRIYRFDAATGALRTTYGRSFWRLLAAGSGGLLVEGPGCKKGGGVYLLDADTGLPKETFCLPDPGESPAAALMFGDTIVISGEGGGDRRVYVYGNCSNGVLEPGEECDDGNQIDGDGCDHNCTVTRCTNGIYTPGEPCPCDDLDILGFPGCFNKKSD